MSGVTASIAVSSRASSEWWLSLEIHRVCAAVRQASAAPAIASACSALVSPPPRRARRAPAIEVCQLFCLSVQRRVAEHRAGQGKGALVGLNLLKQRLDGAADHAPDVVHSGGYARSFTVDGTHAK